MPLAKTANRRVTRHDTDGVAPLRHESRARAGTGRSSSRLAAGMAAADNDDIE